MKTLKNLFSQLNKTSKTVATLVITAVVFSCTPPPVPTPSTCSTSTSDFQTIYNNVLTSLPMHDDYVTMDLTTHEYTFTMLTNKSICKIGYQGNANLFAANIPYTIEIYDNTTSSIVYTGSHIFNSAFTDYVTPIGATVVLQNTHSYTIKRIVTNYLGNLNNTIGRICRYNTGGLPSAAVATGAFMQITSSNFYGTGGPVPSYGIPYIDIIFQ